MERVLWRQQTGWRDREWVGEAVLDLEIKDYSLKLLKPEWSGASPVNIWEESSGQKESEYTLMWDQVGMF